MMDAARQKKKKSVCSWFEQRAVPLGGKARLLVQLSKSVLWTPLSPSLMDAFRTRRAFVNSDRESSELP